MNLKIFKELKYKSILFKVWKFPELSETFIVNQVIIAIKLGFEVKILVEELNHKDVAYYIELFKKYELSDKIIIENYRIPKNKFFRISKAFWLLVYNLFYVFKLKSFIEGHSRFEVRQIYVFHFYKKLWKYDAVHVQYGTNARPLDLLKKISFFPPQLIVSFHGHDLYFPINGRILNNGYYDILFKHADKLIANTQFLKEMLVNLGAPLNKIETIPIPVNTKFFRPKNIIKNGQVINLISIGRLAKFKGHTLGIQCVKILKERGYQIRYTIVGEGGELNNLKKLIAQYNLGKDINLLGRKSQNEIKNLLLDNDIFLMTSTTDPNYGVESQGVVTAEAQACGLPVVAFDSGGVKYTLKDGETGFLCPDNDLGCFTSKIELLIDDKLLRDRMGKEAVSFIDYQYSEHAVWKKWKELYA